jgi:hypothetical protein
MRMRNTGCRRIIVSGDDLGKIWIYDVGEQLAIPQPDEWNKFAHTLQVSIHTSNVYRCLILYAQKIWIKRDYICLLLNN